jgi:hypothetical protein
MTNRHAEGVLLLAAAAMLCGCDTATHSHVGPIVSVIAEPGVSVPESQELARKLTETLRDPPGAKRYVRVGGKLVEVESPRVVKPLSAVVRAYDEETGLAYLDLQEYRDYKMPLVQIWRFDGKAWSDSVDPGIFYPR